MLKQDNQNRYNKKRAKILFKGLIPALIGIFLPKKKDRIIFNSTRNESFNFNSKYLFEYFIKHYPDYEVKFVINDDNKRARLNKEFGEQNNYFIETESFKGMWYALMAYTWVTSAFETPVGGFFLKYNRFVYLLGHGTHFKAIVFNENNLSLLKRVYYHIMRLNFSNYLVTSDRLIEVYKNAYKCKEKQLVVVGEPRHDSIYEPKNIILKSHFGDSILKDKNILYAPTWRPDSSLKLFPFDDMNWGEFTSFLDEYHINIFLRLHPSFQDDVREFTKKSDRIKILDNAIVEDISVVLGFFDLLVTDYSSIHISFLLLEKPVLFLPYDIEQYTKDMGFIDNYDNLTPGPKPKTMKAFTKEINMLLSDKQYYEVQRKNTSDYFNDYKYENCKMNADFIMKNIEG